MTPELSAEFSTIADVLRQRSFVRTVECFAELDSTNRYALDRFECERFELPALIVAARQTAGRGRGSNRWWSGSGGLTFSLIADDASAGFPIGSESRVALLAGLAVADVLSEIVPPDSVGLKWPNDVLLNGRKVCGILTEVPSGRRDAVVIGVGLNVNNSLRSAPLEIQSTATALCDELARELCIADILLSICGRIESRLAAFASDPGMLRESFAARCVLSGRAIVARSGAEEIRGRCLGLHEDGSLIVETSGGTRLLRSVERIRVDDRAHQPEA